MNSYIRCKLIVGHPKTSLEFIKDVSDSLVADYKETEAVSVARNQGIGNLPGKKRKGLHSLFWSKQPSYWSQKVKDSIYKVW